MNNFQTIPADIQDPKLQSTRRLESVVTELFRSLFPQVTPLSTPLTSVKRVLLLNREPPSDEKNNTYTITLRHYAINTKRAGLPKAIKRINAAEKPHKHERKGKGLPNLGRLQDVSEYLLDPDAGNYTSASESEPETDAEVEVLAPREKRLFSRNKLEKLRAATTGAVSSPTIAGTGVVERRGIVLSELGPRMRLKLLKVEEGLCDGKVLWHEFIAKSKEEERELEKKWDEKNKEKEARRRIQRQNVEQKKRAKQAANGSTANGDGDEDEDDDMEDDYESWEDDINDEDAMEEDNEEADG
jgi:ribosome biogenesis protein SSF1/2